MKAAQFNAYGGTDVIHINTETPAPQPAKNQVLVEVVASGINPVESAIRNGYLQQLLPISLPATTGGDFSGVVSQVGEGVEGFKAGDMVYGIANQFKGGTGAVAEYVVASVANTGPKPQSVDDIHAASLPLVGTSALQALEEHIKIKEGQKILIHGGAGGVGSMGVQFAKMHGAYVVATANNDSIEFVKSLGADEVIDYKTQDFTTLVKDFDAVFDTVGGETTNKSLSVLKKGGILVSMAGKPDMDEATLHGVTAIVQMTKGDLAQLTRLAELVDAGKIKSIIDKTFPLEQAKEAYDYLEKAHPKGKIVITIKE